MSEENIVEQTTMFVPDEKVFDGKERKVPEKSAMAALKIIAANV